ncbi:c-type cytochrome domain-containing protein [Saccharobesus litoralis]|nr:c-type cytochrome domain-containing protein [Saccharobesus litoralis]
MAALMEVHLVFSKRQRSSLLNWIWLWGAVSAISACILGYLLSLGGGYSDEAIFIHKAFGISTAVIAIVATLVFFVVGNRSKLVTLGASGVQLLLLFATGHYGANMTHGETYLVEHAPNFVRVLAGFEPHQGERPPITSIEQAEIYADVIAPIFKQNCVSCHNDAKAKGKLNLANIDGIQQGGKTASTLGDGQIANSELYKRITMDQQNKKFMPAEGKTPLTDTQVKAIAWWIKAGAPLTGNIVTADIDKSDRKILAKILGLAADNDWPLPQKDHAPNQVIVALQQQGFLVKTVADKINYLDVDYSSNYKAISDQAVQTLVDAKDHIAYLNLVNSQITLEQFAKLNQLQALMRLRLDKTQVSSAALKAIASLPNLQHLNLFASQVDDTAIEYLQAFPTLQRVYLGQTQVSAQAISQLQQARPDLSILGLSTKLNDFTKATQDVLAAQKQKEAKTKQIKKNNKTKS